MEPPRGSRAVSSTLAPGNSADFHLIGTHSKDGHLSGAPKFLDVYGVAIKDCPSNTGGYGRPGHLRQCGAAHRFENDRMRPIRFRSLNGAKQLRALGDGVVVCKQDLGVNPQLARRLLGGTGLLNLIIVVVGHQGDEKLQFAHVGEIPCYRSL